MRVMKKSSRSSDQVASKVKLLRQATSSRAVVDVAPGRELALRLRPLQR